MKTLAGGYAYDALRRAGYSLRRQRNALLDAAIRRALDGDLNDTEIAAEVGCDKSTVSRARRRGA